MTFPGIFLVRMIPGSNHMYVCQIWLQSDGRVEKKGVYRQTRIHARTHRDTAANNYIVDNNFFLNVHIIVSPDY